MSTWLNFNANKSMQSKVKYINIKKKHSQVCNQCDISKTRCCPQEARERNREEAGLTHIGNWPVKAPGSDEGGGHREF